MMRSPRPRAAEESLTHHPIRQPSPAAIAYGPDGALRTAALAIDTINPFKRDTLVYRPGYALPQDIPGEIVNHRIDANRYYTWADWNQSRRMPGDPASMLFYRSIA
jgi:hypothetical protein